MRYLEYFCCYGNKNRYKIFSVNKMLRTLCNSNSEGKKKQKMLELFKIRNKQNFNIIQNQECVMNNIRLNHE